jgi:hypothetical protein
VHRTQVNTVVGALAGYAASRTMDAATTRFRETQSDESRRREEELAPGGGLVQLGKQLGQARGRDLDDEQAGRVGLAVHRTLGATYGAIAAALVRRGVAPLKAGLGVASIAWLLVDEGSAIGQAKDYPAASHLRGVVGHGTHGVVTGVLLALASRR